MPGCLEDLRKKGKKIEETPSPKTPSGTPETDHVEFARKCALLTEKLESLAQQLGETTFAFHEYATMKKTAATHANGLGKLKNHIHTLLDVYPDAFVDVYALRSAVYVVMQKLRMKPEGQIILNTSKTMNDNAFTEHVVHRFVIIMYHLRRMRRPDKYKQSMKKAQESTRSLLEAIVVRIKKNEDEEKLLDITQGTGDARPKKKSRGELVI